MNPQRGTLALGEAEGEKLEFVRHIKKYSNFIFLKF
jgi:hypothetical protein